MTKDQLFDRLAEFLRENASLVADARDSDAPWELLEHLRRFKEDEVRDSVDARFSRLHREPR